MKVIIDRFGNEVETQTYEGDQFIAIVDIAVSPTFFGWVFQFSDDMEILSSNNVRKRHCEKAHKISV